MATLSSQLLRIHGRVQGVGYRDAMRQEAKRLHLAGWVRNRHDGTVEALVCGNAEAVAALLAWAEQGPRFAQVSHVDAVPADPPEHAGFTIRFD